MREIKLTQGKTALVDDADYLYLSKFKWFAHWDGYNWYAYRKVNKQPRSMHRELLPVEKYMRIDHVDRNGLNNQRCNMRICCHCQNMRNSFHPSVNKSGFKGVSWKKSLKKWVAQINAHGAVTHLGVFKDKVEAAKAYDTACRLYHGEFAMTNDRLGLFTKNENQR